MATSPFEELDVSDQTYRAGWLWTKSCPLQESKQGRRTRYFGVCWLVAVRPLFGVLSRMPAATPGRLASGGLREKQWCIAKMERLVAYSRSSQQVAASSSQNQDRGLVVYVRLAQTERVSESFETLIHVHTSCRH